jgi:hypothetical protein
MINHKENDLILGGIYDFLGLVVPFIRKMISTTLKAKTHFKTHLNLTTLF